MYKNTTLLPGQLANKPKWQKFEVEQIYVFFDHIKSRCRQSELYLWSYQKNFKGKLC